MKQFVKDYPNPARPGLLLIGESGVGKTHLAVAALRGIIEKGYRGLFVDYHDLVSRIGNGHHCRPGMDHAGYDQSARPQVK
jgi:DNA replication protein DnaC